MIKKIFYTLLFVFTCFICLNKVSAETNRMYMSYDNGLIEIGNTRSISPGYKTFTNRITFTDISDKFDQYSTLYVRYAFCSTSDLYSTNSSVVNTNIKCSNSGSIGTLSFFTMSFNESHLSEVSYDPDNNISTFIYETSFNIYSDVSSTFTLYGVNIGRSLDEFPSYDSNSEILDQMDYLYGSLTAITNINRDILYYVMKMYENMVTCRDSYNLFDISKVQSRTTLIVNDDGTISVTAEFNSRTGNTLKDFAPDLKVGKAYTLSFETTGTTKQVYLSVPHVYWESGKSIVITQEMLDSYIYFYGVPDGNTIIDKIQIQSGTSATTWEPYGKQICKSKVDETNDAINESNKKLDETNNKLQQQQDFMNDDDTSGSSSEAESFFEGFTTDTYGLTSIITAPLELIGNIAGSSCSPLPLQIPFVGGTFNLPCMSTIYKKHFGSFLTVYQTITFGIVAYWVCIRIFALVKDFKNPEHDEIEVMDL